MGKRRGARKCSLRKIENKKDLKDWRGDKTSRMVLIVGSYTGGKISSGMYRRCLEGSVKREVKRREISHLFSSFN